jgi:hypothetical protein
MRVTPRTTPMSTEKSRSFETVDWTLVRTVVRVTSLLGM